MALTAIEEERLTRLNPAQEALKRLSPLWPLPDFVAVNPFLGLSGRPFAEAIRLLHESSHDALLPPAETYLGYLDRYEILSNHIEAALRAHQRPVPAGSLTDWLRGQLQQPVEAPVTLCISDWLDRHQGTSWGTFITDEVSKWAASYFDQGQAAWPFPLAGESLLTAWTQLIVHDRNAAIAGMRCFEEALRILSPHQAQAGMWISTALEKLPVPSEHQAAYLHRLLLTINGWASFAAHKDRATGRPEHCEQLLAIRLTYELALFLQNGSFRFTAAAQHMQGSLAAREIAQQALEEAFRAPLAHRLQQQLKQPAVTTEATLQAVFCIDVRSELYRRALEAEDAAVCTSGFAGFFGLPIQQDDTPLCPVLLQPAHRLHTSRLPAGPLQSISAAWASLRRSTVASFPAVELSGWLSAWPLLRSLLPPSRQPAAQPAPLQFEIPVSAQADLAANILKGLTVDPAALPPLVLFCGHASHTTNNPYAASLDCGACGGHSGATNARLAAALLNSAEVRNELQLRGVQIPSATRFLAGLHVTTTDEVQVFADSPLDEKTRLWVQQKCDAATVRARKLRNSGSAADVLRRASDWSEVRPEWGLAGNAAFIAAPRALTAKLNLEGRAFLHDYDAARDGSGDVVNLILNAPVVVASWINLQYYASTVAPQLFGSGNKTIHNVVGTIGVWEGNAGDLRTGLPLQSVHDGEKFVHTPLRLQVFIADSRQRLDHVLANSPHVNDLVENEWICLHAIEGDSIFQRLPGATWRTLPR